MEGHIYIQMQEKCGVTVGWCIYPCHIYMGEGLWVLLMPLSYPSEESSTPFPIILSTGTKLEIYVPR